MNRSTNALLISLVFLGIGSNFEAQAAEQSPNDIPTPTFVSSKKQTETRSVFDITRIAGCYGDKEKSKSNVISAEDVLKEPTFQSERFSPSIFTVDTLGKPVCVEDDEPLGLVSYTGYMMSFNDYLLKDFECGCGSCWDESGQDISEPEIISAATGQDKQEYASYVLKRKQEIMQAEQVHSAYRADYHSWLQKRSEFLSPRSLQITISPEEDIPAGTLSIYNFIWYVNAWCGDTNHAERKNLYAKQFQHPPIAAGDQLTIWLDNVDVDLSWGVLLHSAESSAASDIQSVIRAPREIVEGNLKRKSGQRHISIQGLPEDLQPRGYETPKARSSEINNECCAC